MHSGREGGRQIIFPLFILKQYLYHFYRNSMNETYAVEFFSLLKKTVFLQPYICNYNPKSIRQGISIKIRVEPDMIFFAGCRISGRIIRLSCRILPDIRLIIAG